MRTPRLVREEHGSALIEVALCLPLLLLLLVGVIDFGSYVQQKMQVVEAANAGTAFATIPGNSSNTAGMQRAALAASPDLQNLTATATLFWTCTPGGPQVASSTDCPGYGTPIQYAQVTTGATASAPMRLNLLPGSVQLAGQSTYRVPWNP